MAAHGFWSGATATRGNNDHLAEQCRDELCRRLPCEMFKAGWRAGYDVGWAEGEAAGQAAGYSAGMSAGLATCAGG
jgi:hypothetical protein